MQVIRTGFFDHTYAAMDSTQSHTNNFHCIDFYYYITSAVAGAKISFGWSTGGAPFPIDEVTASTENRWQNYRKTFQSPGQTSYNVSLLLYFESWQTNLTHWIYF